MVKFSFKEDYKMLGHNFEPWQTTNFTVNGEFWINKNTFLKQDTLINNRGQKYTSKTAYNNEILLFLDYGDAELLPLTTDLYFEKIINTARYSPIFVLNYFIKKEIDTKIVTLKENIIYSLKIGKYLTKLSINKKTNLVDKISYLSYDELYGDVTTSYIYSEYVTDEFLTYPTSIEIENINGKIVENVTVLATEIISDDFKLLEKPEDYKLTERKEESKPEIKVTKYNENIHFIDLIHTDDRVMIVEIDDFVLVAEAPINSKNGELIIAEVKKIAPLKPIKYFVFGHHHPHYLGGLRAFVYQDATILCTDISKNYVEYIANAPHTISPDNLQLNPKKIKTQIILDSLVLGKNKEMKIYFMGEKSAHTKDYLIYYFPKDKLLFQDDLCWIPREGPITKARNRQVGLYNIIKELNLEVDTIIQSWPVTNHKLKTIFPFTDLEESVLME
ncbi:hypothetical protein BTO16_04975 [Polaribacter glomeratus]|uniref:Metallo-beta-lactamase domain-containing protein n=2 Tax=Polaribacter glomeratus TaxID=102 RepID=A0A2S7WWH8_9FLAO|nr:hypothetical protein BTO16_04975 [Polaribacter glomeratus]